MLQIEKIYYNRKENVRQALVDAYGEEGGTELLIAFENDIKDRVIDDLNVSMHLSIEEIEKGRDAKTAFAWLDYLARGRNYGKNVKC